MFAVIQSKSASLLSWIKNPAPDHWSPDKPGTVRGWQSIGSVQSIIAIDLQSGGIFVGE